ncbi:MAG: CDP-alcohol phosphatidyltransferase family protein [Polyangiales bacterium]
MRPPFVVVVVPPMEGGAAYRGRVGGLPVALRLILSAQKAGAEKVHLSAGLEWMLDSVKDGRVKVPVEVSPAPDDRIAIEIPVDVVMHQANWHALVDALEDGRARHIGSGPARVEARPPANARVSHGPPAPLVFAPPFGFPPIQVHDSASARRATSALLRACRKPQDGWTSTYINRYASLSLTRLILHTPLRPNHMTVAIAMLGVLGGVLAAKGTYLNLVIGAFLLQVQSMLDGCDGELSRMTFRTSRLGEWLDTVGDDVSNYTFFAGASIGMHRATGNSIYLVIGGVIVTCGLLTSGIEYRYLIKVGSGDLLVYPIDTGKKPTEGQQQTLFAQIASGLSPLFKRDSFILLTFLSALCGLLGGMLAAFAVGAVLILFTVIKTEIRLARESKAQ